MKPLNFYYNENNRIYIENDSKIIIYNSDNNKLTNIINTKDNNERTLEDLNFKQNNKYHLNIKKSLE